MTQGSPAVLQSAVESRPDAESVKAAVTVLKAVGHPLRFRIVDLLASHSSLTVTELCTFLCTKQPIISQQLSILRRGRVVKGSRNGNRVLYSLASDQIDRLVDLMRRHRAVAWDGAEYRRAEH
jgi:ArsR family transcriptional regulator